MGDLRVDPVRFHNHGFKPGKVQDSGIFVRAQLDGKWGSFDISDLDAASLLTWLQSRGGDNQWAENCVGILFGHGDLRA